MRAFSHEDSNWNFASSSAIDEEIVRPISYNKLAFIKEAPIWIKIVITLSSFSLFFATSSMVTVGLMNNNENDKVSNSPKENYSNLNSNLSTDTFPTDSLISPESSKTRSPSFNPSIKQKDIFVKLPSDTLVIPESSNTRSPSFNPSIEQKDIFVKFPSDTMINPSIKPQDTFVFSSSSPTPQPKEIEKVNSLETIPLVPKYYSFLINSTSKPSNISTSIGLESYNRSVYPKQLPSTEPSDEPHSFYSFFPTNSKQSQYMNPSPSFLPPLFSNGIPSSEPSSFPLNIPTFAPSVRQSISQNLEEPSLAPSIQVTSNDLRMHYHYPTIEDDTATFLFMGGVLSNNQLDNLKSQISRKKAKFFVHLGNFMNDNNMCNEAEYVIFSSIMKNIGIPIFHIPGINDWKNCIDSEEAWSYWKKYFLNDNILEQEQKSTISVNRLPNREENFSFLFKNVIFFGLKFLQKDETEYIYYSLETMNWMNGQLHDDEHKGKYNVIIVFGDVSRMERKDNSFLKFLEDEVRQLNATCLYINGVNDESSTVVNDKSKPLYIMRVESGALPIEMHVETDGVIWY